MYRLLFKRKQFTSTSNKLTIQVHISSFRQICGRNRVAFIPNIFMQILLLLFILLLFKQMRRVHCQQMVRTVTDSLPYKSTIANYASLKKPTTSSASTASSAFNILAVKNVYYDKLFTTASIQNQRVAQVNENLREIINQSKQKEMSSLEREGKNNFGEIPTYFEAKKKVYLKDRYKNEMENTTSGEKHYIRTNWKHNRTVVTETSKFINTQDSQKLLHLVMNGLGLRDLPDMQKLNISQTEYVNKYNEYLQRLHNKRKRELDIKNKVRNESINDVDLMTETRVISFWSYNVSQSDTLSSWTKQRRKREFSKTQNDKFIRKRKSTTLLHFSKNTRDIEKLIVETKEIEEANLRLLLIYNPALVRKQTKNKIIRKSCNTTDENNRHNKKVHTLNIKLYQRVHKGKRLWLDNKKIDISIEKTNTDNTQSRWLQFDVTRAIENWLKEIQINLDLELQCDNCLKAGARILSDVSASNDYTTDKEDKLVPVINIITRPGQKAVIKNEHLTKSVYSDNATDISSALLGESCQQSKSKHPRCCRHSMQVVFSQIKGFEFIIQPKTFDAGYCFGRCPIRYNPAHHHAMLQGLIWKQSNGLEAPRPCCAPSKLVELEVLHVDEKNSDKLKISTWTDMRVIECACS